MDLNQAIQKAAQAANQGRFADADKICRDIITANDKFHPAFHLLGQLAAHASRNDIAVPMLERAAALDPTRAYYQRDLAEILIFDAKSQEAIPIIERAIALDKNDPKAHFILGLATMSVGIFDRAIDAYQTAIKLKPDYGPAYNNLGSIHEGAGDLNEAKNAYSKAIKIDKNNAQAQNNLASILIAEGDIKSAISHLETAINTSPEYIEAHHNLSALKTYTKNDGHINQLEETAKNASKLTMDNQIRLEFLLGKVHLDIGDIDKAFSHYNVGNKKKRATFEYQETVALEFTEDVKVNFPKALFKDNSLGENDDRIPIFITGMPRSGSTLIEQILVSHSDISSAGELTTLNDIVRKRIKNFPSGVDDLSEDDFTQIGKDYLSAIERLKLGGRYIIDKMPGNYRFIGLIVKALPQAKIIHTTRNPMDCCFSIYTRLFLETLHYGYDLEELGRYFRLYQELMGHWHGILPSGHMVDVAYEDVVDNLKSETEKIFEFLNLDWQENILQFYSQKGNIKTASAAQVRKPIYKTSIERWRPYEKHLGSLKEILEDI